LGCALLAAPHSALAQVIEIAPDGAAAVYTGPVATADDQRQPIVRRPSPGHVANVTIPAAVAEAIRAAATRRQLSDRLIEAVAWEESRLKQNAVSPKGARGVMQLMPSTARRVGVDPDALRDNLDGGAAYLARLLQEFDGDIVLTLAAYNAGPGAVRRFGGVPPYPETRAYVAAVLDRLAAVSLGATPASEAR
jgi:soluble lytic murein transglycosylase-like protein